MHYNKKAVVIVLDGLVLVPSRSCCFLPTEGMHVTCIHACMYILAQCVGGHACTAAVHT